MPMRKLSEADERLLSAYKTVKPLVGRGSKCSRAHVTCIGVPGGLLLTSVVLLL